MILLVVLLRCVARLQNAEDWRSPLKVRRLATEEHLPHLSFPYLSPKLLNSLPLVLLCAFLATPSHQS